MCVNIGDSASVHVNICEIGYDIASMRECVCLLVGVLVFACTSRRVQSTIVWTMDIVQVNQNLFE